MKNSKAKKGLTVAFYAAIGLLFAGAIAGTAVGGYFMSKAAVDSQEAREQSDSERRGDPGNFRILQTTFSTAEALYLHDSEEVSYLDEGKTIHSSFAGARATMVQPENIPVGITFEYTYGTNETASETMTNYISISTDDNYIFGKSSTDVDTDGYYYTIDADDMVEIAAAIETLIQPAEQA